MRKKIIPILIAVMLVLGGCKDTVFFSSVPSYPVQFELNIWAEYPHFVPDNGFQTLCFTKQRYEIDYLGYAGLLIWVDMNAQYKAADLCCPHCLTREPVRVDGFYAVCDKCGEQYDLSFGLANPMKGISNEALRHYTVLSGNGKLRVSP